MTVYRRRCSVLLSLLYFVLVSSFFFLFRRPPRPPLFPYTPLFRSEVYVALDPIVSMGAAEVAFVKDAARRSARSEEHTSELQSPYDLVCRLLLEKKKKTKRKKHTKTNAIRQH